MRIDTIDTIDEIRAEIERRFSEYNHDSNHHIQAAECASILDFLDSLRQKQDRMRYCIEYINPQYPLLDNGELNIRHLRVPDEHGAEMALTLMLSLGAKIYRLYRGNVQEGKLAEWPTPMIVDADDWYSTEWLHNILD